MDIANAMLANFPQHIRTCKVGATQNT